MTLHVFLLLLLFVLVFSLTRLCFLHWPHHCPAQSAAARRTPIQRLLKPRSPNDCPACRLSCPPSSLVEPVPSAVRPWREVKSRRGAPKRIDTACMIFRHQDRSASPTSCPSKQTDIYFVYFMKITFTFIFYKYSFITSISLIKFKLIEILLHIFFNYFSFFHLFPALLPPSSRKMNPTFFTSFSFPRGFSLFTFLLPFS